MQSSVIVQVADLTPDPGDVAGRRGEGALLALAERLGAVLRPLHPGTDDPRLSRYFVVVPPESAHAGTVASAFRELPSVAAAYVQALPEPPQHTGESHGDEEAHEEEDDP